MEAIKAAHTAAEAALSRKGGDVAVLDLRGIASFADFFVICTGSSDVHAEGIAEAVQEKMEEADCKLMRREGRRKGDWILLDYVDVIVHVFVGEVREQYGLERLWADAPAERVSDEGIEIDPEWEEAEEIAAFTARDF